MNVDKIILIIAYTLGGCIICYLGIFVFATTKGIDFPSEKEIQYSYGTLDYKTLHNSFYVTLFNSKTGKSEEFSCEYTARTSRQWNICVNEDILKSNKGKDAEVGWYMQSPLLWYNNPTKQLVSLKVNGKEIQSYNSILEKINLFKRFKIFSSILLIIFTIFIFYKVFVA